jgi:hypothetical protein
MYKLYMHLCNMYTYRHNLLQRKKRHLKSDLLQGLIKNVLKLCTLPSDTKYLIEAG